MRSVEILLVEDDPGDVRLVQETLKDSRIRQRLNVVEDGVAALAFLRHEGQYSRAPRPDIILLDLNLPRKSGREVLAEIKGDNELKHIPVIVLTTSDDDKDIQESYGLHANCYITKPGDLSDFIQTIKMIEDFWFDIVNLPSA